MRRALRECSAEVIGIRTARLDIAPTRASGVEHLPRNGDRITRRTVAAISENRKTEVRQRDTNLVEKTGLGPHLDERHTAKDLE